MANILELQSFDTDETPGADKKSTVSVYLCHRSIKSYFICWTK